MRQAAHRRSWLDHIEQTMADARRKRRKGRLLLLAPRDHGKTELAISIALRQVCLNRDIRILWISEAAGVAEKRVRRLRTLLTSDKVVKDWCSAPEVGCGPFRAPGPDGEKPKWTNTQIYVTRQKASVDPTIEAVGSGGSITGGHFDLILCHEEGTPMLHEGDWIPVEQHPSFRGFRECSGVKVQVWGVPFSETVTPEHRYWARARNHQRGDCTKRGHTDTPAQWVEAKDLTEFHMLGTPIDTAVENVFPELRAYEPGSPGDGTKGGGRWVQKAPPELQDPEWWWAFGLWWGDGHMHGSQLAWSCAYSRPDVVARLQALARKYGKPLTKMKGAGAMDVYLYAHASLARWLRTWYGETGKQPPLWVERLGPEYQRALLRGYLDADGYVTPKNVRLTSIGLGGLLSARRMLARQGIAATIRAGLPAGKDVIQGRTVNRRQKYDLRFHQGREVLGYEPVRLTRRPRDFIEGGFLWTKVRALEETGVRRFAPIKTSLSTYITHYGLSHNCDDLEDDRTVYTAGQREKTRTWWGGTVLPMLSRGGTIAVIGTRKHHDDLYHHLNESPLWSTIEDPAIYEWPESYKIREGVDSKGDSIAEGVDVVGESRVLWPEERPIEYLLEERYNMGSLLFGREFQHQVQDDAAAAIKKAWLEAAKRRGARKKLGELPDVPNFVAVQGWDLALVTDEEKARRSDSDYVVGIGWGKDPATGDRYLFSGFRHRGMTPGRIRGEVIGQFESCGGLAAIRAVGVERNAFGELHYMGLAKTTDLPMKPHLTTGAKKADPWDGIPSLATLFENGKVVLPYHEDDPEGRAFVDVLCDELWGLGREPHDDTALALWVAECVLRGSGFQHRVATGMVVHDAGGSIYDTEAVAQDPEERRAQELWDNIAGMFPGQDFEDGYEED